MWLWVLFVMVLIKKNVVMSNIKVILLLMISMNFFWSDMDFICIFYCLLNVIMCEKYILVLGFVDFFSMFL